jgi:AraC-like DNA-binding protein
MAIGVAEDEPARAVRHDDGVAYRELPPPPDLAHVVRCMWVREQDAAAPPALVLPDGCVDVVVRAGHAVVAGPDTGPVEVTLAAGDRLTGLRFRPGAAAAALGVPADELLDRRVALEDLWGPAGREAGERAGGDPAELAAALRARLAGADPDPRMLAAAQMLAGAPALPVPALATRLGLGERHLRRRFSAAVGYGPKTFARVARFRRALALIAAGEPLVDAALAAGYADQAHMTRELGALAGRTPRALRAG